MSTWLITGANGNLGRRLITGLLAEQSSAVVAVVRSERAGKQIVNDPRIDSNDPRLQVRVLDYQDVDALAEAAQNCSNAVHLVGILKQTRHARYVDAHEGSCAALTEALAGSPVRHLTYLSIVGAHPEADNSCLASKGRAEQICLGGPAPACVLRVPMVLGEGDYATAALAARAAAKRSFSFRADSLEQPIYAGDVVSAILAAATVDVRGALDLGGPEVLSRRALTERAARILGNRTQVVSLPISIGYGFAALMELISANPPLTRAMLGVLDHDDCIDTSAALERLQMSGLTSLDDTLKAVLIR